MRFLSRFSLRNPVVIIILTVLLAIGGALSASSLNEELFPNISLPVITVITGYPGAAPNAVASDVSDPLEKALRSVAGVKNVTSTSVQNVSEISLELHSSASITTVEQNVQQTVNQVQLPTSALRPNIQQFSFNAQPVIYFTITSKYASPTALRNLVNQTIVPGIESISGVGSVQTAGAEPDQVQIQVDAAKLATYHLTLAQVLQNLQSDNLSLPVGSATYQGYTRPVQLTTQFQSLADIKNLPITLTPSANAGIQSIGATIGRLGHAVGTLGSSVGQLGQGLGMIQAENQLMATIQSVQGQLFGAELELARQITLPKSAQSPLALAKLQGMVTTLQEEQKTLMQKLQGMMRAAAQTRGPSPAGGTPSAGSSQATPALTAPNQTSSAGNATLKTIPLSALATVTLAQPTNVAINRTNGKDSVLLSVVKTDSANTVTTVSAIQNEMQSLTQSLPFHLHVTTIYDAATVIKTSIDGLIREALLGALFAALVILLFLRNGLTTLIAIVSIPVSLLIAFIFLNQFNVTINIMSLGGMAVATGRVVDDSIVVIENIHRSYRRGIGFGRAFVLFATGEVAKAITSSTITTVAVFLPLGLVSGIIGKIFFPFALTVVISLISSLLVALTLIPLLAWLFIAKKAPRHLATAYAAAADEQGTASEESTFDGVVHTHLLVEEEQEHLRPWQLRYQGFLRFALTHKALVIILCVIGLVASVAVLPTVGSTFLPQSNDKYATISVTLPVGSSLQATNQKAQQVEQRVQTLFDSTIETMNVTIGSDPGQSGSRGSLTNENSASFFLQLNPATHVSAFVKALQQAVYPLAGSATIQAAAVTAGGPATNYALVVSGNDPLSVSHAAARITSALQGVPGLTDVKNNLTQTQPQIQVTPNLAKASQYGLTAYQIASVAQNVLAGQNAGTVSLNGQTYTMIATLNSGTALNSLQALRNLPISTATGQSLTLGDVAQVQLVQTAVSVLHRNGSPYAEITATFTEKNTGKATRLAQKAITKLNLPAGVTTALSGTSQQQNQSFGELIQAVLVAAGMVYIVMLIAFGEWSAPFSILFAMPVALIGAFFGTVIARQPISVSSLIGILMLMGIVVTNAIVLIDRVEQQRKRGRTVRDALLEAGTTRLRPILMTAIATICALAPLAAGLSEGALISQGLAVVVIGGLVTSTILTLFVVPIAYELLHRKARRKERSVTASA